MGTGQINTKYFMITAVCAVGEKPQSVYCSMLSRPHQEIGAALSSFAKYQDTAWSSTAKTPKWNAIAITAARVGTDRAWLVVALGEGGQIWEYEPHTQRV
jgi:hypothetical protein